MFGFPKFQRRKVGIIDRLPDALHDSVDKMLLAGVTYREVVAFLGKNEVPISQQAVSTYARRFLATTQQLRMSQENYRVLLEEMRQCPEMDSSEAIVRVAGNAMLNALANATPEDWDGISHDKLLKEMNSFIRVTAYKQRVDMLNKTEQEKAIDGIKNMVFETLYRNKPELYNTLVKEIEQQFHENDLNGV